MDNHLIKSVFAIASAVLMFSISGCSSVSVDDEFPQFFIAEVDMLEAPGVIDRWEMLTIRIAGTLGPTLCYQLDYIEMIRRVNMLDLTVHGKLEGQACFDAFSVFDELILITPPILSPDFTIVIHQSDGSTLEHVVIVEENQN